MCTCVQLFEGFVCEKCDPRVRDDPQDGGHKPPVKSLHAFLLGDPYKNMHDVAVPAQKNKRARRMSTYTIAFHHFHSTPLVD